MRLFMIYSLCIIILNVFFFLAAAALFPLCVFIWGCSQCGLLLALNQIEVKL